MASSSVCAPLNDFDWARRQTHYTQNILAPSQLCLCSAFGSVCAFKPRITMLTYCSDWSGANHVCANSSGVTSSLCVRPHSNALLLGCIWDFISHVVMKLCHFMFLSSHFSSTCPVHVSWSLWLGSRRITSLEEAKQHICIPVGYVWRWKEQECSKTMCFFAVVNKLMKTSLGEELSVSIRSVCVCGLDWRFSAAWLIIPGNIWKMYE